MLSNDLTFSVAMPVYNSAEFLKINIPEILRQISLSGESGELLVINDCSTDSTKKVLEDFQKEYPDTFRYFNNIQNLGRTRTRNLLVKQAGGKYIIFIDSDIFPSCRMIEAHLKILSSNKNIICQGNLILINEIEMINKKKPYFLTDFSTAFFATGNVSVEKNKLIEAGLFDEQFTGYGWEDLELGIRLKQIGLKIIRDKNAFAYHYEKNISLKDSGKLIQKEKERAKGAVYFYKKHPIYEVKMMTQLTKFHFLMDKIISMLFGFEKNSFIRRLEKLEERKFYKILIPLFRLFLNHYNILELQNIIKQK